MANDYTGSHKNFDEYILSYSEKKNSKRKDENQIQSETMKITKEKSLISRRTKRKFTNPNQ